MIARIGMVRTSHPGRSTKVAVAAAVTVLLSIGAVAAQTATQPVPGITDCSRPSAEESYFCDSPTLRAAEAEVARLASLVRGAGPMWWSVEGLSGGWKGRSNRRGFDGDLHTLYAAQAKRYGEVLHATTGLLSRSFSRDSLRQTCIVLPILEFETFVRRCRVEEVVGVAPGLIAQQQMWDGAGGPDVRDSGFFKSSASVVLEYGGTAADSGSSPADAGWKPVAWTDGADGGLGAPVVSEGAHGTFITIPKYGGGTSAESKGVVVRRVERLRWREVDAFSWKEQAERRIPRPLVPRANAPLDLANLSAELILARPGDATVEPTGGKAEVQLALRNDALVVDGVTLRPGPRQPPAPARQGGSRR